MKSTPYNIFVVPYEFAKWKESDANARIFFEWFRGKIDPRLAELESVTGIGLDYTFDNLVDIARWYAPHVEIVDLSLEEEKKRAQDLAGKPVYSAKGNKLTEITASLAMDIGIYFCEIIRKKYPFMRWGWVGKPKSYAYLRLPILTADVSLKKRYLDMAPYQLMENLARKIAKGRDAETEMKEMIAAWRAQLDKVTVA